MSKDISKNLISETATLRDAMSALNKGIYGVVFVVDDLADGVVKGILTDGDIRRVILSGAKLDDALKTHMNTEFTRGSSELTHEDNVALLSEKIRHLPILDASGRLVDLISWAEMWRLPVTEPYLGGNELKYVSDCITSNWISSQGHYISRFEDLFKDYLSVEHAVATSSGTTALHLALMALGIGPGDEVIVPDLTFAACANVVIHAGATPVFVDISEKSWTLDPELVKDAITEKTRAIMPVHLYGHPADMDPILDIAREKDLFVIEDCAESLGAKYKGELTGKFGHAACFSFFANKVITTGEGGMLVTNDKDLKEKVLSLRDHGMSREKRYWHEVAGFNYRMTNMQAAIGVAQMERIDSFLDKRAKICERYAEKLSGISGISLPPEEPWADNIFWLYTILIDEDLLGISAADMIERLSREGIETRPAFAPLNAQPPYPHSENSFPVSERIAKEGLSLPTGNDNTIEDIDRVSAAIKKVLERLK